MPRSTFACLPGLRHRFLRQLGACLAGLAVAGAAWGQPAKFNPWGDEVLYFVLIDRFADGDPNNNPRVDLRNPGGWHGGDLKGLTQQLDELKDLGITALWINPVQQQQPRGEMAQAAGLPEPRSVNGTPQIPMEGKSLVYSFDDAKAKERHTTQYFEISGNRAIYHDGWFARTIHRAPWEDKPRRPLSDNSAWELFDVRSDFSLANDLAVKHPKKLAELQKLYLTEAGKYHVLPMDDRVFERLDGAAVGRPDLMRGRTSITLSEGMTGMMEAVFPNVKNRSKTITAEIEVPASGGNGTVIAQGGRFGGWSLYVKDGMPGYDYNFLGLQRTTIASTKKLGAGKAEVRFQFDYDGGGPAKGGKGTLFVNGEKVAEGRIPATQPGLFSADETADVGIDLGTPVVEAIGAEAKSRFNGRIPRVTVQVKP